MMPKDWKVWDRAREIQEQFTVGMAVTRGAEYYCTQPGFPDGCIARGMSAHNKWPGPCDSCEFNTMWIPTSDDLEGMIDKDDSVYDRFKDLSNWIEAGDNVADYLSRFFFEPRGVWLAYIMATLYAKFWDGENWRCVNSE